MAQSGTKTAPAQPAAQGDTMKAGDVLRAGQSITSANKTYTLIMQADGNLVLYRSGGVALWASQTRGKAIAECIMQADGNLVLYEAGGRPDWASNTQGTGNRLVVQNDGNVVIYRLNGSPAWATNTVQPNAAPTPPAPVPQPSKSSGAGGHGAVTAPAHAPAPAGVLGSWPIQGLEIMAKTFGGNGGDAWQDPDAVICKGPISKAYILADNEVRGLRFCYGDSGIGGWHGTMDNKKPVEWDVPQGESIVRVEGRSGDHLDAIRFFTDKGTASDLYGGNGGQPFSVEAPSGGSVYAVSGRSGSSIDQLTFHCGWPYVISDVTFDPDALANPGAGLISKPTGIAVQEIYNKTSVDQNVTYAKSVSVSTQSVFSWQAGQSFTYSSSFSAGIPKVVSMKLTIETSISFKEGKSTSDTETKVLSWTVPVKVPAHKKVRVVTTALRHTIDIPYTYTVAWYKDDPKNVVKRVTFGGQFHGVDVTDLKHDFEESAI